MMNINNINSEKVTVKSSSINEIKIPMIQRDYVQGLNDNKLIPFLNVLINTLKSSKTLSLDFIYGNINEDGVFEPIDGQQRLTTLALLTFYLYCRQENIVIKNNPFTHITYATRQSAKNFCMLLKSDEFKNKFDSNKIPSDVIKENLKYFSEYNEDITISAMLKTLDKIHDIISKENTDINNLIEHINNINFHIFPMESFNLSDDLYIKMNGRGKQLSSFDNFKADYFKWLEKNINIIDELIPNITESSEKNNKDKEKEKVIRNNKLETLKRKLEALKRKFDTDYLDIFWDYALENSKDTSEAPDPEKLFFRFINRFVVGKYLLLTDTQKNNIKNDFERTFFDDGIKSEKDAVVFNDIELYTTILHENKENYTYNYKMINVLENLSNLQKICPNNFKNILNFLFNPLWEDEKLNIFPKENGLTYKQVLIFNAITSFLEQDSIIVDNIKYDDYNKIKEIFINENKLSIHEECENNILMTLKRISRIVWNVTEQYNLLNSISNSNYKTVISRLDFSKLDKTNNIYDEFKDIYGSKGNNKQGEKHNNNEDDIDIIIKDEVKKCQYIFEKPELEQKFIELESLDYLHGITGFLLDNEIDFDTNHQDYLDIFNNIDKVTYDDHKMYNINNNNKLLVRLLIYKLYKSGEYTIHNKYFSDTFIRTELIANTVFRKHMHDLIIDIIKNGYQYNLPKINEIEIDINALNRKYNPYFRDSIISILYDKIDNEYVINKHYIDTSVAPCIEHNKYFNKSYKKYKRLGSIIVEQHVCDMVNYIVTTDGIQFNNDEKPEKINYSCEDNSQERKAYKHLIYYNNGHLIIYFKIKDRRYSVWFIYQDNQVGITDETDQNNKKELKKQYSNEKFNEEDFKTDVDTIKQMIKMLADNNITLADLYNDKISDGFYKR